MRLRDAGVFTAGFCTFLNLYSPQSLLPTLAAGFDTSAAATGLTITGSLLAVALVAPFVGGISDAVGRRRLIVPASLVLTVPTALCAVAPSLDLLVAARFAQGLLLPFIFAVTVAYIADECPGTEGVRSTGTYSVGTIVGGFSGRFLAGWTAQFAGWRASFALLAAITLAAGLFLAASLPPEQRFRPVRSLRGTLVGFATQLRNRQVTATCGIGFAVLFSVVAAFTFVNVLLAAPPYGLGPAGLGSIFVIYLVGAVITPPAARLVLRVGRRRTVVMAAMVAIAGMALTLVPSLAVIVAGLALLVVGIFTQQMVSIGYVAVAGEGARSTAVGLYVTTYYIGGSLGGVLPASIWSHAGWPGCVELVIAVQAAAALTVWTVWPERTGLR